MPVSDGMLHLQTLYESAVAFGMRKALQTEQGKNEMEARIQQLEGDVKDLERQVRCSLLASVGAGTGRERDLTLGSTLEAHAGEGRHRQAQLVRGSGGLAGGDAV